MAQAYITGVEHAFRNGVRPGQSVASFFVSRIDALVDGRLDRLGTSRAGALRGNAATAAAGLAYDQLRRFCAQPGWLALAAKGADPQRLLWASTSTKDDRYSDVKYLDELLVPGTVTTVAIETLEAYRDHGNPVQRVEAKLSEAQRVSDELATLGVELNAVGDELQADGIRKFAKSYDQLLAALEQRPAGGGLRSAGVTSPGTDGRVTTP